MRPAPFLLLAALAAGPLLAQTPAGFSDRFSDGDFTADPAWSGTADRFSVDALDGDPALRTAGPAEPDTLWLTTPSAVSYGTWRFTFAWRDVNLTNSNGARIFLMADTADLSGAVRGYFVQLGTNNADQLRLYRVDGDLRGGRVELGRSGEPILAGEAGTIAVEVTREAGGAWTVTAGGAPLFTATDDTYGEGVAFGVWVKHSSQTGGAYFFDDLAAEGVTAPPDETPPALTSVRAMSATRLAVAFDEPVDGCRPEAYEVSGGIGVPAEALNCSAGDVRADVALRLATPLMDGEAYTLTARGVADAAGNVRDEASLSFTYAAPDTAPPTLIAATPLDARTVAAVFSEALDPGTACRADAYVLSGGIGRPQSATCEDAGGPTDDRRVVLALGRDLEPQRTYTLTATGVADAAGNVRAQTQATFAFTPVGVPMPGDVVVNEIMFAPDDRDAEYVELLNRSEQTLDLSLFQIADATLDPVPILDQPIIIEPGGFLVLARDAAAVDARFPDADALEVAGWPSLNNSGDLVLLLYSGVAIDSVAFEAGWGATGTALERRDPAGPSDAAVNWGASEDPAGGTPGEPNSLFGRDRQPPQLIVAEQASDTTVRALFSEPIDPASAPAAAFRLGGSTPLAVTVEGAEVRLRFGEVVGAALDVEGVRDFFGNVLERAQAPLARLPQPGELVLNEILYAPLADPDDGRPNQPEYVELISLAPHPLTLRGLFWTDAPDETGAADTLRLVDGPAVLSPDGLAVLYAQPDPAAPSALTQAFPNAAGGLLLPVPRATLGLGNGGDVIRLHRPGRVLDALAYAPTWHSFGLKDATGVALERIDPRGPSDSPNNWSSSVAAAGGTPGAPNSVGRDVEAPAEAPGLVIEPSPFSPDEGVTTIRYTLREEAALLRVRIFDGRGRPVRTIEESRLSGPTGSLSWDGYGDGGERLRVGIYVVLLEAVAGAAGATEAYKAPVVLARRLD